MKIRQKIILYFSATTIFLTGLILLFIYTLFAEYREEEFQQRLKDKITTSIKFLNEVRKTDRDLLLSLDRITINELYEEKILLFDEDKKLIYSSIDDTKIIFSNELLESLNADNHWIETKEGKFDVVAIYIRFNDKGFYGINKAYDTFGYSKLNFLGYVILAAFFVVALVILFITFYLSKQISQPINTMALEISNTNFDLESSIITVPDTKDEINYLARKFNELMKRLNDAFAFQKHAIHHISHELKTPIAVLVSNFERIENEKDPERIRLMISNQKENTKNLGDIINDLLEISKTESGNKTTREKLRIDDLIFDLAQELKTIYTDAVFQVDMEGEMKNEEDLTVYGNKRLLKSAFTNLLINSIQYSSDQQAVITIAAMNDHISIEIINLGMIISVEEKQFLFQHFFRGENSKGKRGFGLGLVLINKIILLHGGTIRYSNPDHASNKFSIILPLATSIS